MYAEEYLIEAKRRDTEPTSAKTAMPSISIQHATAVARFAFSKLDLAFLILSFILAFCKIKKC